MKEVKSLLFFLLSIPTFIFGQVVTDGLILNLDTRDSNSYSGSGNTWNDISGNNYNATIVGGTSFSNNQFTLQAGTYHIFASCCAVGVDNHNCRIYNITDSSTLLTGLANKNQEENVSDYAHVRGQFTISGTKVFELQHRCQTTVTTHGFGAYASWNGNVYSTIEIHKRS